MKALVSLKVEIIEGEDKGYTLEEKGRCIELDRCRDISTNPYFVNPYRISVEFMTPSLYKEMHDIDNYGFGGKNDLS